MSIKGKTQSKKIIQVPMDEALLQQIDAMADAVSERWAAFIREACSQRLKGLEREALERQYVQGYREQPEDLQWAEASARILSKRVSKEKW